MPNLDELSHDMSFTLGGETFVIHDVAPSIIEKWDDEDDERVAAELEALESDEPAAKANGKKPETLLERLDRRIITFLTPDDVTKYKALRARKTEENPVPAWKVVSFYNGLLETQTGRPTTLPSNSQPGAGRTARSSGAA